MKSATFLAAAGCQETTQAVQVEKQGPRDPGGGYVGILAGLSPGCAAEPIKSAYPIGFISEIIASEEELGGLLKHYYRCAD